MHRGTSRITVKSAFFGKGDPTVQKSNQKPRKIRSYRKNLLNAFLCAIVIFASALLLASCSKYGGSDEILSKDQLLANAEGASGTHDYVCEYLDEWNFPTFDIKKIKDELFENLKLQIYKKNR